MSTHFPSLPGGHTPNSFATAVLRGDHASEKKRARDVDAGAVVVTNVPLAAGTYTIDHAAGNDTAALLRPLDPSRAPILVPLDAQVAVPDLDDTGAAGAVVPHEPEAA